MFIAVTSQNRRNITSHAGKCHHFWIYEVVENQIIGRHSLGFPVEQSLHDHVGSPSDVLPQVEVLITRSMGEHLHEKLQKCGIQPIVTLMEDPDLAVTAYLAKELSPLPANSGRSCHHKHHD